MNISTEQQMTILPESEFNALPAERAEFYLTAPFYYSTTGRANSEIRDDIPNPRIEVTEHRSEVKICPCCGCIPKGIFPECINAPVQL